MTFAPNALRGKGRPSLIRQTCVVYIYPAHRAINGCANATEEAHGGDEVADERSVPEEL